MVAANPECCMYFTGRSWHRSKFKGKLKLFYDRLSHLSWLLKTLLMLIPLHISSTPFSFNSSNTAGSWIKIMLVNYQRCRIGTEWTFNSTEHMNQNAVPSFSIHKWSYPEKILPSNKFCNYSVLLIFLIKHDFLPKNFRRCNRFSQGHTAPFVVPVQDGTTKMINRNINASQDAWDKAFMMTAMMRQW